MTDNRDPYRIPQSEPLLVVISGPSGVGKDSIIQAMKERALPFYFVVLPPTVPGEKTRCTAWITSSSPPGNSRR